MMISLTFPDNSAGLNLSGPQRVQVVADPLPVSYDIYVDDVHVSHGIGAKTYLYTLDTTKYTNGTHIIRAEAIYKSRRSRTSVTVTIKNGIPTSGRSYGSGSYGNGPYGRNA